ncbi:uncharacterized protein LOC122532219 [Frieseomelitta varia]|uniref:uncharacterized protein LOC122532219 n=1 Tax=Frieseomelitta varia TaxID=561572 RepID=UPI001CB6AD57|nr:uncharacterized protein LOC122532219 [Frieseomelitta varia]XP_043516737.1 uncharacterized protein LOC122532219 [Frieseomelitta varia]
MKAVFLVLAILGNLLVPDYSCAPVKSEAFVEEIDRVVNNVEFDKERLRGAYESVKDRPDRNCYSSPCGWNEYDVETRQAKFFVPNTCRCPDSTYKCVRTGETLSIRSYVYHCKQNTTKDDIEEEDLAYFH